MKHLHQLIAGVLAAAAVAAIPFHAAQAQAPRKVVIAAGTQVLNSSYPYLMMPQALGYWKEEGLDVEVIPAGGSSQAIQQVLGRSADFAEVNSGNLIDAVSKGAPLRAVMANTTVDWSLVAPAGGAIRSVADFKGKSIGVATLGSGGVPLLKAFLRANGLDPDKDVTLQPVGFGAGALLAMNTGRVDGLMYWASAVASFELSGTNLRYFRAPEWKNYADFSLVTSDATLKDNAAVVEGIVRGMAKASYFTVSNAECARKMYWKHFPQLRGPGADDATKARFDLRQIEVGVASMMEIRELGGGRHWAVAPVAGYDRMQQFMIANKVIEKGSPAASLVPPSASLLERANNFDHEKVRQAALKCEGV